MRCDRIEEIGARLWKQKEESKKMSWMGKEGGEEEKEGNGKRKGKGKMKCKREKRMRGERSM